MKLALCLLALLPLVYSAAIAEEERSIHFGGMLNWLKSDGGYNQTATYVRLNINTCCE